MVYINKNNAKIIPKIPGDLSAQAQSFPRVFFLWANMENLSWAQLALSCPALNSDEEASNCCRRANTLLYRSHKLNHTLYRS